MSYELFGLFVTEMQKYNFLYKPQNFHRATDWYKIMFLMRDYKLFWSHYCTPTSIKYKVERDERYLPYIELGRWLCSHFQLETPLNFHKPITQKLCNLEK